MKTDVRNARDKMIQEFLENCQVPPALKASCRNALVSRLGKVYFEGSIIELSSALERNRLWVARWPTRQNGMLYGKYSKLVEKLNKEGSHYHPRLSHSHMVYRVLSAHTAQSTYMAKTSQIAKLTRDALRFYKDLAVAKGTMKQMLTLIQPQVERLVKVYQGYAKYNPDFDCPKKLTDIYRFKGSGQSWKSTRNSYLPPRLMRAAKELRRADSAEFAGDIHAVIQGIRSYGHICTIALVAEFGEQMNLPATECKAFMQVPSDDALDRAERIVEMLQKAFKSARGSSDSYTSIFG